MALGTKLNSVERKLEKAAEKGSLLDEEEVVLYMPDNGRLYDWKMEELGIDSTREHLKVTRDTTERITAAEYESIKKEVSGA